MNKLIIGMIAVSILCVYAVQAEASTARLAVKTVQKIGSAISKGADSAAKFIWKNKGAVAVGATATAVVTKPETLLGFLTVLCSGPYDTIIFWLLIIALIIIASRSCIRRVVGRWRILPLLVVGILLFGGGIAEAGVFGGEMEALAIVPPWGWKLPWDVPTNILLIVIILFGPAC